MLTETPVKIGGAALGKADQVEVREASQAESSPVATPARVTGLEQNGNSRLHFLPDGLRWFGNSRCVLETDQERQLDRDFFLSFFSPFFFFFFFFFYFFSFLILSNSSDPKGKISFYAFSINNKVLLYFFFLPPPPPSFVAVVDR